MESIQLVILPYDVIKGGKVYMEEQAKQTEKVYCIFDNNKQDINTELGKAFSEYLKEKVNCKETLDQ